MDSLREALFPRPADLGCRNRPCRPGDLKARASRHGVEEQLGGKPQKQAAASRTGSARLDAVLGLRSATPLQRDDVACLWLLGVLEVSEFPVLKSGRIT